MKNPAEKVSSKKNNIDNNGYSQVSNELRRDRLNHSEALASMGTWEMDGNGVDIFWSDEFYRLHGLLPQSIKPSSELRLSMVHPEDRAKLTEAFENSYQTGKPYSLEKRIMVPNGEIKWVLSKGEVSTDPSTSSRRMLGVIIDITDRKLMELEKNRLEDSLYMMKNMTLQKSLEEFQQAISSSSIVSRADKAGIITYVNENFVKISGYSVDELIGQNHRIVNSDFHPRNFWVDMWKTIANGKIWRADVKNKAKDGSYYWVDTFIMPFLDEKGRAREFLSIRNDITQRKAQEENIIQLNQSLADFQDAIQFSSIVSRADKAGLITYVNENFVKISGYHTEELIGQNHRIINSGYHPKSFWVEMWKTIASGKTWRAEVKNKAKDGSFYWVDTFVMPFLDEHGKVKEFLSIRNDITSRKDSEEALSISREKAEAANKAKSEFLANMSHEIRTPLNGIIGFTDLLTKTSLDRLQSQYMTTISQSAYSLLDIVNNILDFSKIEAGKMELAIESTNLLNLCTQVIEIVSHQAHQKNIRLFYTYENNIPKYVYADSIRLKQVLVNLLGNAIKFTSEGEIELKIEGTNQVNNSNQAASNQPFDFRFSVRDTGVGIKPENQQKIFEAFSQEDSSITKKYGGTGLGLSISNKLLNMMNSRLYLNSKLGQGSTFYFKLVLPVSPPLSAPKSTLEEFKNEKTELHQLDHVANVLQELSYKILVVEDNVINMALVKSILTNISPQALIMEAVNGKLAVEKYIHEKPDILFMDVQMPEMNGYEATSHIRSFENLHSTGRQVPIIALTAGAVEGERKKCLDAGMNDFIAKPIINNAIEKTLNRWLLSTEMREKTTNEANIKNRSNNYSELSLTYLSRLLRGRKDQINEMLSLFVTHTPTFVYEIKSLLAERNWVVLKNKVHGIKSYYSYMGDDSLNQKLNQWEIHLAMDPDNYDHEKIMLELETKTKAIVDELKNKLPLESDFLATLET